MNYTVEAVGETPNPWNNEHGDFLGYELVLKGLGEPVTVNQKPETAAPKVGDVLDLELRDTPRGKVGKKVYTKPQGSSDAEAGRFDRKPDHPENVARMHHTSALSVAPRLYEQLREEGVLEKPADKAAYLNTLSGIVKWVEDSYPKPPTDEVVF